MKKPQASGTNKVASTQLTLSVQGWLECCVKGGTETRRSLNTTGLGLNVHAERLGLYKVKTWNINPNIIGSLKVLYPQKMGSWIKTAYCLREAATVFSLSWILSEQKKFSQEIKSLN